MPSIEVTVRPAPAATRATTPVSPVSPVSPGDPDWEARAALAFRTGEPIASALRTAPPGTAFVLTWLASALLCAVAFAAFWTIEITTRAPVARVAPSTWVAFVAEHDRARAAPGQPARIRWSTARDARPVEVAARLQTLSDTPAGPDDWRAAMGEAAMPEQPLFMATLAAETTATSDPRAGQRAEAVLVLEQRTLLSLLGRQTGVVSR